MEDNGNLSKFVDQFNDNPAKGGVGMPLTAAKGRAK